MTDQNKPTNPTAQTSTPSPSSQQQQAQPAASTSVAIPQTAQPAGATTTAASPVQGQTALNNEMIALVQALFKMQNSGQVDPALSQNSAVQNLYQLVKSGKLNQQQLLQFARMTTARGVQGSATASTSTTTTATPASTASTSTAAAQQAQMRTMRFPLAQSTTPQSAATPTAVHPAAAYKTSVELGGSGPTLANANPGDLYPAIRDTLSSTNPGPVQWPTPRPTLTGGLASGRVSGTPAQIARAPEDVTMLSPDDNRARKRNTPGDQSMRRTIQDLVSSIDPNVKIEPEVEDLLLNIADEFIDSVTNFACRLAKHRGGDTLEVRDLQLHLERNHNIRIPGFASDETRLSLSQSTLAPSAPVASSKKGAQGPHTTLRSQRLAQVQQAKREAKLM